MCERCSNRSGHTATGPQRRKKLWETDSQLHCSIVGTCLTLGDLRRIADKLRIDIPAHFEDHDIHGHFAGALGRPGLVAKAMHKALERKHAAGIRRFSRVRDENAVSALWARCLDEGDIPGPYWALITHPSSSRKVVWNAFGHVHMLSHLVGASNRADIRKLKALEDERETLIEDLITAKRRLAEGEIDMRTLMQQHADEVRDLDLQLSLARKAESRLEIAERHIRDLEGGEIVRSQQSRLDELGRRLATEAERRESATIRCAALNRELEDLRRVNETLQNALHTVTGECESLESALCTSLEDSNERTRTVVDLCGSRIVYVGGRTRLVPHLRALVLRSNGTFIHHDGGIEENGERLSEILAQGDAVLCPVDCVSHGACRLAKRVCKQRAKAFVPLRSSGVSSFVSGLREIATTIEATGRHATTVDSASGEMNTTKKN